MAAPELSASSGDAAEGLPSAPTEVHRVAECMQLGEFLGKAAGATPRLLASASGVDATASQRLLAQADAPAGEVPGQLSEVAQTSGVQSFGEPPIIGIDDEPLDGVPECSSDGDGDQSEHFSDAELCSDDSMETEEEVDDADEDADDQEEVAAVKDEIIALAGVDIEAETKPEQGTPAVPEGSSATAEAFTMAGSSGAASGSVVPGVGLDDEAFSPVQSTCFHQGGSYPDQNLPPKTGIAIPMMATTPHFIRSVPEEPELLYSAPETLFDDIVKAEADRISHPENVRNKIVFDSVGDPGEPSGTQAPNVVEAMPPNGAEPWLGGFSGAEGRSQGSAGAKPPQLAGLVTHLPPYYRPEGPEDRTLVFESRFESGNLRRAVQVYDFEYDLILNPDYNTRSHTQWYLFRVSNTRRGPSYRFNILNMVKPTSVYNEGMRPLQYSTIDAATKGIGWVRGGEKIIYYQNGLRRQKGSNYYTLTFTVQFQHDCDEVYFSHCYPYTYTDLQMDLRALDRDPEMVRRFRRRKLCETLAGNACDLITITSFNSDPAALKARRAVVITARVHPGESNASWVMKGILDYLTGASVDARILRDNFVFKIIPMLNPDGVIVGNYRCSLAGQDLNRLWDEPSRKMHPTIFFAKSMSRHLLDDREVILFVDIHGHSRKKNVFMYGNSENNGLREKIFPGLLCRSSDCFSFDDCCFKMQKSKESTARVVSYRELGVINSYTLEASFCGADFGPLGDQHFTTRHLEEMGYMVCDAILDFCDPDQTKVMLVCKELQVLFPDDGNSDDVSDSEDDGAAALRRKKRAARKEAIAKAKKDKPPAKKKKPQAEGGDGTSSKSVAKDSKEPKTARSTRRKSVKAKSAVDESAALGASSSAMPEASDGEQGGDGKTKGNSKKNAKAKKKSAVKKTSTTRESKVANDIKEGKRTQRWEIADSGADEVHSVGSQDHTMAIESAPAKIAVPAKSSPYKAADIDGSMPLPLDVAASAAGISPTTRAEYPSQQSPGSYPPTAPSRQ